MRLTGENNLLRCDPCPQPIIISRRLPFHPRQSEHEPLGGLCCLPSPVTTC